MESQFSLSSIRCPRYLRLLTFQLIANLQQDYYLRQNFGTIWAYDVCVQYAMAHIMFGRQK